MTVQDKLQLMQMELKTLSTEAIASDEIELAQVTLYACQVVGDVLEQLHAAGWADQPWLLELGPGGVP